jgi:hypothetical protein
MRRSTFLDTQPWLLPQGVGDKRQIVSIFKGWLSPKLTLPKVLRVLILGKASLFATLPAQGNRDRSVNDQLILLLRSPLSSIF